MAYPYGGLSSYGGGYQQNYQSNQLSSAGLAGYGHSMSSEQIDYNNNNNNSNITNNNNINGYNGYAGALGLSSVYGSQYSPPYASHYAPQPYASAHYGYYSQYYNQYHPQSQPVQNNATQTQVDTSDPQLQQQIEQIVSSLSECRRPMLRRQVITVPSSCPGRVTCITRRLPTPPPDVIERITVIKPPRDVVNLCIEKPYQPGPCFQQREICGKPRKPLIQPRVVSVPPRSNPCSQPFMMPPLSGYASQTQSQQPATLTQTQQPLSFCAGAQSSGYPAAQSFYGGMPYSGYYGNYGSSYGNSSYFGKPVC